MGVDREERERLRERLRDEGEAFRADAGYLWKAAIVESSQCFSAEDF